MNQLPIGGLAGYNTDASAHRDWKDDFVNFLGLDTQSIGAERELIDGKVKANWRDRIFSKSTEELTNAKMKSIANDLRKRADVQNILDKGGSVNVNDSVMSIANRQRELLALDDARDAAASYSYSSEVADLPTARLVNAKVLQLRKAEAERKSNRIGGAKYNARKAEERQDDAIEYRNTQDGLLETIRQQTRTDQLSREKQGDLNRLQDRQLSAQNNQMMMQLEYARMLQADRQRAAERKDQAIMALLGGLGNLRAAFTV